MSISVISSDLDPVRLSLLDLVFQFLSFGDLPVVEVDRLAARGVDVGWVGGAIGEDPRPVCVDALDEDEGAGAS